MRDYYEELIRNRNNYRDTLLAKIVGQNSRYNYGFRSSIYSTSMPIELQLTMQDRVDLARRYEAVDERIFRVIHMLHNPTLVNRFNFDNKLTVRHPCPNANLVRLLRTHR